MRNKLLSGAVEGGVGRYYKLVWWSVVECSGVMRSRAGRGRGGNYYIDCRCVKAMEKKKYGKRLCIVIWLP